MASFYTIPTIDLSHINSSPEHRFRIAKEWANACRTTGFLQITNHGVTQNPNNLLKFFDIPADVKMGLARGQFFPERFILS